MSRPDRKNKVQICHVNLLKRYFSPVLVGLVTSSVRPRFYIVSSSVEKDCDASLEGCGIRIS